jgi:ATP-dependent Clp protease adaptor protein ClpS
VVKSIIEEQLFGMSTRPQEFEQTLFETEEIALEESSLVIYNDDFNTFEHVIETLVRVCKHTLEQAEHCTWLIHYKGKCAVKNGQYEILVPMKNAILEAGIDAKIH